MLADTDRQVLLAIEVLAKLWPVRVATTRIVYRGMGVNMSAHHARVVAGFTKLTDSSWDAVFSHRYPPKMLSNEQVSLAEALVWRAVEAVQRMDLGGGTAPTAARVAAATDPPIHLRLAGLDDLAASVRLYHFGRWRFIQCIIQHVPCQQVIH